MATDFSNTLKQLRKNKGLTQAELAQELGMSKSSISMYEIGAREPDFETLEAFADYFNVDMNYLTGWSDDPYDYEGDPDGYLAEIPIAIMEHLLEAHNGDLKAVHKAYTAMVEDAKQDSLTQRIKAKIKDSFTYKDEPEITFDDFTYALHAESQDLTEENKQKLLEMAKLFKLSQEHIEHKKNE
ncbi:helix-turn-helix domain-containing protein [Clostridium minihomine]|uniref:helix-turn-helix domain-containing protein n=1 Tax=Clostridium minihomine TaxID=2045012 RepID=UPI000C75D9FC|nr:helix-turn-helix transcriptional regulator [Clostridium minihomine]